MVKPYRISVRYSGTAEFTVSAENETEARGLAAMKFEDEDLSTLAGYMDWEIESVKEIKREVRREWYNDRVTIIYEDGTKKEVYMD